MNNDSATGMTPRARALAAFAHKTPDIVPAYIRGLEDWEKHAAHFGGSNIDELFAAVGNTICSFYPPDRSLEELDPEFTIWGIPVKYANSYTSTIERPLANAETVADIEAFKWPDCKGCDFAAMHESLKAETRFARLSPSWDPIFARLCDLFGMEEAMMKIYTDRNLIEAALAKLDEYYTSYYEGILENCADELDIFGLGDDFAGNSGLLISPDIWRELFKPLYAKWLGMAKSKGLYTFMHSCGNLMDVLPDLIDIGLDGWQTVQTHLPGQSPEIIKREFGKDLVFIGAVDTTNILSTATPAEVSEHVRKQILALGKDGGYIVAPDHTIMKGTPPENVAALYRTCAEFRMEGYTKF